MLGNMRVLRGCETVWRSVVAPEEFTQCLVSRMDIGFRDFDLEKYHQKYHHFSVRLLCGAFETL